MNIFMPVKTPDQIYGDLFSAVQLAHIFPDSKSFADAIPLKDPDLIMKAYNAAKTRSDFNLNAFIQTHFNIRNAPSGRFVSDTSRPLPEHIELLWDLLTRQADEGIPGTSLIPLPHPYIVPGGRFREIYYWDSYFTMLGLAVSGRRDIILDMVRNFAWLIDRFGHIPNGNRTYFLSRSQPPFFALMVLHLAKAELSMSRCIEFLPSVRKEYDFWIDRPDPDSTASRRTVRMPGGELLNRYYDDHPEPRQESYREDVLLSHESGRDPQQLYVDIRAACESGWDFSSRWFEDQKRLSSIITTRIVPVDLNCLLWTIEDFLAKTYNSAGDVQNAEKFSALAIARQGAILRYFWNDERKCFCDYDHIRDSHTDVDSLAMAYPLFTSIAPDTQAAGVASRLKNDFLMPGGFVTTLNNTGQQWDAPNGWAPLQWICIQGLINYGYHDLALEAARCWCTMVEQVYKNTGKLLEKYNVQDTTLHAGGGEYPVQDGFGWTNGVTLKLLSDFP